MAMHTCYNCVYGYCDPEVWLRDAYLGNSLVMQCANHPWWPGRMHDVTGVPCRNYRPKPRLPGGDAVRLIPLGDGFYAYVDAADYEWLNQWNWYVNGVGYAARYERNKRIYMHREIMQPPPGMVVDHIDGNKSNNCRFNLRNCTRLENQHNKRKFRNTTSRFKGVSYNKRARKWFSAFGFEGDVIKLGYFSDEIEAARVYDRAAVAYLGEFARLNFPEEWPPDRRAQVHAEWLEARKRERRNARRRERRKTRGQKIEGRRRNTADRVRHRAPGHEPRATCTKAKEKSEKAKGKEPRRKTHDAERTTITSRAETRGRRVGKQKAKSPAQKARKKPKAGRE